MITMDDDRSSISSRYRNRGDTEISNILSLSLSDLAWFACIESNQDLEFDNSIFSF